MSKIKPFLLIICDGLGHSELLPYNAVNHANMVNFDAFWVKYPHALLTASGKGVGLLESNPGNSEVGHQTIGTGRITPQPISIVMKAIKNGSFFINQALTQGLDAVKNKSGRLHVMGLLSDAGIHSHDALLYAAIKAAEQKNIREIYLHVFLDGRDKAPKSAGIYLQKLDVCIQAYPNIKLATVGGRFYGMDRDKHWDRIEKSYHVLTRKEPSSKCFNWQSAIEHYYAQNITDEFIPPTQLDSAGIVQPDDGIFFFNIRPDRARQLTQAFIDPHFNEFKRTQIPLACFITPVSYGKQIHTQAMFLEPDEQHTLTDVLLAHHKTVYEIAETEKYAHVSYFFNGGREEKKPGETRVLIESLHLKTYESHPCMSAPKITQAVLTSLEQDPKDFYVINYANADMVGHSGNFDATTSSIECLDKQLGALYNQAIQKMNGNMIITADHGNAEEMFDIKTNQPKTAHTSNKVPFIFITKEKSDVSVQSLTSLADIAPFILRKFKLPIPKEMRRSHSSQDKRQNLS